MTRSPAPVRGKIAELRGAYGYTGRQQDGRGFAGLGPKIESIAQSHGDGGEDGRFAHDGGNERGDDGRTDAQAGHGAHEAAAHAADTGQRDTFTQARGPHDLAEDKATDGDDGHISQPRTEDDSLFDAAKRHIEHGQQQTHSHVVKGVHGPCAYGPESDAQEHDHVRIERSRIAIGGQQDVEQAGQSQRCQPFDGDGPRPVRNVEKHESPFHALHTE